MKNPLRIMGGLMIGVAALSGVAVVSANGAGGVVDDAFYVDGELYRTVVTPTDLSGTGAPDHTFDTIYVIDGQPNVAEAAPGDRDYNGGRWIALDISFADYDDALLAHDANSSGDFDTFEEVEQALMAGDATNSGELARFACPVIKAKGHP